MKKFLCVFLGIMTIIGSGMALEAVGHGMQFAVISCVSEQAAVRAVETAVLKMTGAKEHDVEDRVMQIVYQLARRSIVKVVVKDAAGSGVIWNLGDGIVIVSNRHLLMRDVTAEIIFGNGQTAAADVIGYSQQYDIGFVRIPEEAVAGGVLRDIYEAVPVIYSTESDEARAAFVSEYGTARVMQVGAVIDQNTANVSIGNIIGLKYVPLFNTHVLETACLSRAGMSGGGVFDEGGHFLGMISGGEVPEGAETKEAGITYSMPPVLIAAEYEEISNRATVP